MFVDSADFPITVAEIVQSLRTDPILVEETMGSGHTDEVHDRLTRLAATLPFPTYVALVSQPTDVRSGSDSADYLATALHNRIGKPGLYIVETTQDRSLVARPYGTPLDATEYGFQADSNRDHLMDRMAKKHDQVYLAPGIDAEIAMRTTAYPIASSPGDYPYPQSLPDKVADRLLEEQDELMERDTTGSNTDPGERSSAATAVGLGIFVCILLTTLAVLLRRRMRPAAARTTGGSKGATGAKGRSPQTASSASRAASTRTAKRRPAGAKQLPTLPLEGADLDRARHLADQAVTELAGALSKLPSPPPSPEAEQRALLDRDAAELLLRSDAAADVIGALVLGRIGRREVQRAAGDQVPAYRPCFFDPLHGEARDTARWRFGEGDVTVPVCQQCGRDLAAGRTPRTRVLSGHRRYFEGDDVWARTGFGSLTDDLAGEVLRDRHDDGRGERR